MKCTLVKSDGNNCNAHAMRNSQQCFRHNKNLKGKAMKASSDGGKAKKQYLSLGKPMSIKTPHDIKNLMEKSINKLWSGEMPANNPAGALGYLAKIFLEAYEKNDIEIRLEQLEDKINKLQK